MANEEALAATARHLPRLILVACLLVAVVAFLQCIIIISCLPRARTGVRTTARSSRSQCRSPILTADRAPAGIRRRRLRVPPTTRVGEGEEKTMEEVVARRGYRREHTAARLPTATFNALWERQGLALLLRLREGMRRIPLTRRISTVDTVRHPVTHSHQTTRITNRVIIITTRHTTMRGALCRMERTIIQRRVVRRIT